MSESGSAGSAGSAGIALCPSCGQVVMEVQAGALTWRFHACAGQAPPPVVVPVPKGSGRRYSADLGLIREE